MCHLEEDYINITYVYNMKHIYILKYKILPRIIITDFREANWCESLNIWSLMTQLTETTWFKFFIRKNMIFQHINSMKMVGSHVRQKRYDLWNFPFGTQSNIKIVTITETGSSKKAVICSAYHSHLTWSLSNLASLKIDNIIHAVHGNKYSIFFFC